MSTWAYRMHRGAATISNVVTSCGHTNVPYPTRMEKVKFGVPLDHVCKRDIPGPLLILILKLNKEAPCKKDVFRAPGHQGNMKKLIHFMQHGRLVNIDNFSVYTIASVLKKFLRKLPGGIFGPENEELLFDIIELDSLDEKRERIHRLISSLPVVAQHLLVLLFGTFRSIAVSAERSQTGMTSEALGVSVAPSFFQSCVSDGKMAKMEDVVRFKVATRIMKFLIDNFGVSNLFGRENYEYYARITGRVLKIEEDWIFAFRYPPDSLVSRKASLETERTWLQQEAERWGLRFNLEAISSQEECQSTPALIHATESMIMEEGPETSGGSLANLGDYTRLSVSLEENGLYKSSSPPNPEMSLDELKAVNFYAESTKSLSFLPQVHERQTARMRTRSEWFLNPSPCPSPTPVCRLPVAVEVDEECGAGAAKVPRCERIKRTSGSSMVSCGSSNGGHVVGALGNGGGGVEHQQRSTPTGSERQLVRRTSSKEKRLVRRSSSKSKQDKENGSQISTSTTTNTTTEQSSVSKGGGGVVMATSSPGGGLVGSPKSGGGGGGGGDPASSQSAVITEQDCTEVDVQTFHITLTYKPRI